MSECYLVNDSDGGLCGVAAGSRGTTGSHMSVITTTRRGRIVSRAFLASRARRYRCALVWIGLPTSSVRPLRPKPGRGLGRRHTRRQTSICGGLVPLPGLLRNRQRLRRTSDDVEPSPSLRAEDVDVVRGCGAVRCLVSFPSLCFAGGASSTQHNVLFASTAPAGGRASWRITNIDPAGVTSLACVSDSVCVAGDSTGHILIGRTTASVRGQLQRQLEGSIRQAKTAVLVIRVASVATRSAVAIKRWLAEVASSWRP